MRGILSVAGEDIINSRQETQSDTTLNNYVDGMAKDYGKAENVYITKQHENI